ncbi:MAG TPA: hypothetical protein VFU15_14215 [Bacteroidia bacterium]|nr:hypothetical protein [Bacteroidia bacterium]
MQNYLFALSLLFTFRLFAQTDSTADPLQSMVLSICSKVENENRLAGNMDPDSTGNLPFGIVKEIGVTRYIIAVDSAKFRTPGATFSAYMALEFPGSAQKICFAAQNVAFNPKGVVPGPNTRLMLVSEHRISLGPKVSLVLRPDGFNYVEWDCNGFEAVNLKGYFEFDPGMIFPDPEFSSDSVVRCSFQLHTNDIHNFIAQLSFPPFCIRGADDLSFTATDATADFSELSNAPNMVFPAGYNLAGCNGDPLMWTGFYIRQFRVKLPRELAKNGTRPEIIATNLLIDNSGVSGFFQAENLFGTSGGSMNGWGFSLASIGAGFTSNHLNGGNMSGYLKLPLSETDSIAFSAALSENPQTHTIDYSFSVSPANDMHADVLSANLTLSNSSLITVTKRNGILYPVAQLNGTAAFGSTNATTEALSFQSLTIASEAPVLRSGTFSLSSSHPESNSLGGFGFSLNSVTIGQLNGAPAIRFGAAVNFMDPGSLDIGVSGGFTIVTKTTSVPDEATGNTRTRLKWEPDHVSVDNINVAFGSGPFSLNGTIQFRENDPVYGKGFSGQLAFAIADVMPSPASSSVWFGKVNNLRYFYVDAAAPVIIPFSGASIYRLMGGVYYHMHRNSATPLESQLYTPAFGAASAYVPDANTSLGIRAGVTLGTSGSPDACNGDVALEMNFNTNGGIAQLSLSGTVFFMTGINERLNKPVSQLPATASMLMQYDFNNHALHAVMGAQIHLPSIAATGTALLHYDPQTWYVYVGRPQQRVNISLLNIGNLSSYIEAGTQLDPIPPPPPQVMSVVNMNNLTGQRNTQALEGAGGFAFGASFGTGFNGNVGFEHFGLYYGINAGAGFDIMVMNYGPHAHCANTTNVIGFNGWYATGQVYAYLQGLAGVQGEVAHQPFNVTILNLSAAAVLQARLPDPGWVGGAVGCDYEILGGLLSGHVDFSFEAGSECTIVGG